MAIDFIVLFSPREDEGEGLPLPPACRRGISGLGAGMPRAKNPSVVWAAILGMLLGVGEIGNIGWRKSCPFPKHARDAS